MTTAETPEHAVDLTIEDGIATVTLDRPDRLNAYNPTMRTQLIEAFDRTDADDSVRVVVVTGRGRAFCAGADLSQGASTFNSDTADERGPRWQHGVIEGVPRDGGGTVSLRIARSLKPVIAAVNGPAVGIGATLQLPMDIRIAAASARFGFVFARRGLVPEAASSWFLPRVVGISTAMEWVATGRLIDAQEALAGGLVSRVVPDEDLLPMAYAIAREIADNTSPVAVAASRQMLWQMLGESSPWDAHRVDSQAIHHLGAGADVAEGVSAFLDKRSPSFPMTVSRDYPDFVPVWPATPKDVVEQAP